MKNIMERAWEIYRTLTGDHIAKLSMAMRQAWAEVKAVAEARTTVVNCLCTELRAEGGKLIYSVSMDTYKLRAMFKADGYDWNPQTRAWEREMTGNSRKEIGKAVVELNKQLRKNAKNVCFEKSTSIEALYSVIAA